ncbi:MAG: hypothetical protein M3O70_02005 [Actinomycetota bacterium]|nr:hypothetical protein [Actinomycetota bacterium]
MLIAAMLAGHLPDPQPPLQAGIDDRKERLRQMIDERRRLGGPLPEDIERWAEEMELHPWRVPTLVDDAAFVRQSVPSQMRAGDATSVTITMRNSGTKPWTRDIYGLRSLSDDWDVDAVALSQTVAPGDDVTLGLTSSPPAPAA